MLNYLWAGMLLFGIGIGCWNGTLPAVGKAVLESGGQAVLFAVGIVGVTAFWCGMLEVLDRAGGIRAFSVLLRGPICRIFPESRRSPEASRQILTNLTANFFGLGNGATPSGIAAVRALQQARGQGDPAVAGPGVCLFLVINSAAFQLLPSTLLALRASAGSSEPFAILAPTWIASLAALFTGIAVYQLIRILSASFGRRRIPS